MTWKRLASVVAAASMATSAAVAMAPAASAQSTTSEQAVQFSCRGNNAGNAPTSPITTRVSHPETIAPGEGFSVTFDPGQMRNNSRNHARFTYDIAIPEGLTLIRATTVGGATNMGGTPSVTRVNASTKNNDVNGQVLRIWGGQSARWGSNSGTGNSGGLTVSSNNDFRFPSVRMDLRAPQDIAPGTEIDLGLAGAGGSNDNAAGAQLMYSGNTGGFFGSNFQNECAVPASAGSIGQITVADVAPVSVESTTRIVGGDRLVDTSIPTEMQAQVAVPFASAAEISQGTVTFTRSDTGEVLATANPDANGFATATYQFDRIPDDEPDEDVTIVATYSGVVGLIDGSEDSVVFTLTPKPVVQHHTNFNLRATLGAMDEDSLPVTVTATFQRPALAYPEDTMVQLYRDGEAVGEPRPMPDSGTTLTWTDDIPRSSQRSTHRYTVELETIRVEYDQWTGATATPVAVIVTGTGIVDEPEPETPTGSMAVGSLNSSALDPGSVTGSAENFLSGSISDRIGVDTDVSTLSSFVPSASAMLQDF